MAFKKKYDRLQRDKALALLKEFEKRIKAGEWDVENFGSWLGVEGRVNLKLVVKIRES